MIRYSVAVGAHEILVDDYHHTGARIYDVGDDVALNLASTYSSSNVRFGS